MNFLNPTESSPSSLVGQLSPLENGLREPGALELKGVKIDITKIKTPCFILVTEQDHIGPWHSIYPATDFLDGDVEFILGGSGYIAGVINPANGRMKYGYRTSKTNPPSAVDFLAQYEEHPGSWWPHWAAWVEGYDTKMVLARKLATRGTYKVIEAAPGSPVRAT